MLWVVSGCVERCIKDELKTVVIKSTLKSLRKPLKVFQMCTRDAWVLAVELQPNHVFKHRPAQD